MKAYEWAAKFSATKDVFSVVDEFVTEAVELLDRRTKSSMGTKFVKSATEGAIRETGSKWLAVIKRCPRVSVFTFDQIAKMIRARASEKTHKYVAA